MASSSRNNSSLTIVLVAILIIMVGFGIYKLLTVQNETQVIVNQPIPASPIATTTPSEEIPNGWKVYTNSKYSYSIQYPPEVTLTKNISVPDSTGAKYITYKAGTPINVEIQDQSVNNSQPSGSNILISPLYVSIRAEAKPRGYSNLKNYVNDFVIESIQAGQNSAAGVYATSTPATVNNNNGYLAVISDGSVVQNRDDNYFFESGNFIYRLDVAYSGFAYNSKDKDEVARVTIAKDILSSFKINQ